MHSKWKGKINSIMTLTQVKRKGPDKPRDTVLRNPVNRKTRYMYYVATPEAGKLVFTKLVIFKTTNRVRNFRGRVSYFNQSEARKGCFLASDWLKYETLPR